MMGIRGEVFSTKVILQNRTYFFNVKENRMGDLYLNIVESKNKDTGGFERQSVILFADDLPQFLKGFEESLKVLEKSVRENRRGSSSREGRGEGRGAPRGESRGDGAKPRREYSPSRGEPRGDRESRNGASGTSRGPSKYRPAGAGSRPSSGSRPASGSRTRTSGSVSSAERLARGSPPDKTAKPRRVVKTKRRDDNE
jgi:hypothetical protein